MDRHFPKFSKQPACVNCTYAFTFRDPSYPFGPKSPCILPCGHSVCESCIRSVVRNKATELVCPSCSQVSEITNDIESSEHLRTKFPINLYLVGKIQLLRLTMRNDDSMITFKKNKNSKKSTSPKTPFKELCYECGRMTADFSCDQCEDIYCNQCFDKVHRAGKSLKKHEKKPLTPVNKTGIDSEYCDKHKDQKLEFYCPECDSVVCAYCVISNHMNHGATSLKEKNAKLFEELKKSLDEASDVLKRLEFTQKKALSSGKATVDENAVKAERAIISHFSYLHGYLQLKEAKLLAELKDIQNRTVNSLQNVISELDISIKEAEEVIATGKTACDQNASGSFDYHSIIDKLKKLRKIPCHLYVSEPSQDHQPYGFSINPNVITTIEEHCNLTLPEDTVYVLKTEDELPEDYVIEAVPQNSSPKVPKSTQAVRNSPQRKKSHSQSSDRSESSRASSSVCKNTSRSVMQDLEEGTTEQIVISHFTSPSEFYVHRKGSAMELMNFSMQFKAYASVREDVPNTVEIGNIYLVKYKMDDNWYRARVTANVDADNYEVFYIDYGNTEVTSAINMRSIPERFLKVPSLAVRCSIFGCVPIDGTWSTEAINIIVNITTDIPLTMVIMKCNPGHYEVDLSRLDHGIVSLRDALVFLELATLSAACNYPMPKPKMIEFFSDLDLKTGSYFDVSVSSVNSPGDFYVQRLSECDKFFHNLQRELNATYNQASTRQDLVYTPKVGMAVVAENSEDGNWYRAKVRKLAGKRMVEIFFVDTGKTETLLWNKLRVLQEEFLRLARQAMHCSLIDIGPKIDTAWSKEVCEAFKVIAPVGKRFHIMIENVVNAKTKVVMYEQYDETDVCINALLVSRGLAKSTGVKSTVVEFRRVNSEAVSTSSSKSNSIRKKQIKTSTVKAKMGDMPKEGKAKNVKAKMGDMPKEGKAKNIRSASSSATEDETSSLHTDNESEDLFRVPVSVLSIISPGHFFISIPSLEKQIKALTEEMNEFYSRTTTHNVTWKKDSICAVFRHADMNWYRGIVLDILSESKIKVMLKDIASEEDVQVEAVQILDTQFCSVRDGAILCHLSKIIAPGGVKKWPGIACEIFMGEVKKYTKLYISKTGDIEDGSLPVELWAKHAKALGPLDPILEEWISINKVLVEQGFALPDKSFDTTQTPVTSADVIKELAEYKTIPIDRAIVNWLDQSYQSVPRSQSVPVESNRFMAVIDKKASSASSQLEDDDGLSPTSKSPSAASSSSKHVQRSESDMNSIKDWLPPIPFKELEFEAVPTYVDDECCIYLQDPRQSSQTLDVIGKALMSRYNNSKPSPTDMYWFPGQLCIALYHQDQKWYRAKVISVNSEDDTVRVLFVDYGNVESCKATELRKNICMGHIPIQCHPSRIEGIIPISEDGRWPVLTLDFIHLTIVAKHCFVELKEREPPQDGYVVSSIKSGDLDLFQLLVSMHYATYVPEFDEDGGSCSSKPDNEDEDEDEDEDVIFIKNKVVDAPSLDWYSMVMVQEAVDKNVDLSFVPLKVPELDEFEVNVTAILSVTDYVVQLSKSEDKTLLEIQDRYDDATSAMQQEADQQPVIKAPYIGKPSCAQFTGDKKWYRALVIGEETNKLKVQYVDFGNIEYLPVELVKEIKKEWVDDVPVQGVRCKLAGISIPKQFNAEETFKGLIDLMLDNALVMKIKSRSGFQLSVEFYNSEGELAYQPLLDKNLLVKLDHDDQ